MYWFEEYIGRPWAAVPNPPHSFTCGELGRYVLRERLGLAVAPIYADAAILRQCVDNLNYPELYSLYRINGNPQPYDFAFLARCKRADHLGIAVATSEGIQILHCQQGAGVILNSQAELLGTGFRRIDWFRHKDVEKHLKSVVDGGQSHSRVDGGQSHSRVDGGHSHSRAGGGQSHSRAGGNPVLFGGEHA